MMEKLFDVAVVGGGIAGFSAALTAKNLRLDYLWLADAPFQKAEAAEYVRNYPAFVGDGKAFSEALARQCAHEEVAMERARVDGVYRMKDRYTLTAGESVYSSRTVILCTGVERAGAMEGEREFLGRGVSYCAVCDGAIYRGKEIAAVLYAPQFAHEVEYLAAFASRVHVFFFCKEVPFEAENIVPHAGRAAAVRGKTRVETIVCGGEEIPVSGVFFLKNAAPPSALCGGLETDGAHVRVGRDCASNLPGLFAAGDITGTPYQYAKAAGEGLVAAYSAKSYLQSLKS